MTMVGCSSMEGRWNSAACRREDQWCSGGYIAAFAFGLILGPLSIGVAKVLLAPAGTGRGSTIARARFQMLPYNAWPAYLRL